jgi:hypothetical protein
VLNPKKSTTAIGSEAVKIMSNIFKTKSPEKPPLNPPNPLNNLPQTTPFSITIPMRERASNTISL